MMMVGCIQETLGSGYPEAALKLLIASRYGTMRDKVLNLRCPIVKDATDVAIATIMSGIQVSRVELLDEVQVKAVNIANGKNLPEVPTLMFEFIGTEAYSREQTLIVQKIVSEYNGSDFIFAEDSDAKKELWKIRKEALWACFAMEPSFQAMFRDIDLLFIR